MDEKIQLIRLREWKPVGGEPRIAHKFFDPPILADSVQDLFLDPNFYVSQIPEAERWNVYYTACKAPLNTRDFIEQDIIPFDIDGIDVDKKESYIEPICAVLGIESNEVAVTFSGNGLQIIVGIANPIKNKNFFDQNRDHYKAICEKINEKLSEISLPGHADPAVFSTARILRMPETENVKPNKPRRRATVLRQNILANGFKLDELSGIPKLKKSDAISISKLSTFATPDVEGVLTGCDFIKYLKQNTYSEPEWYAALSILGRLPDGYKIAKVYSESHPKHNPTNFDSKLNQALTASGPRTCLNINSLWGKCGTCPNFQKVKTPLQIKTPGFVSEKVGTKISETFVVSKLWAEFGQNLIKKNGDLFLYRNGVWKYLSDDEILGIKAKIIDLFGSDAKSKDAESAFKSFVYKLKTAPVDMFKPNPYCVNFLNGTLHIFKNDDQSWGKRFLPHNPEDYLINQLRFEYDPENTEENHEFLDMIDRVFADDPDKTEKIQAIQQMYGACLIPAFPHLFMLFGRAGTGKTSIILPLYEFLREENICSVEPYQFQGFSMESMAGKLVNIVTDINTNKPMEDANIKKIEDRVPVRIDRKFKAIVHAPLPAIHIFGGNDIPPTLEGSSRAHERRWTFIEFKSLKVSGHYDKSFSSWVFNKSPRGVLNFALKGLESLLQSRGHFINPSSGKDRMSQWLTEGDVVEQFLQDIKNGEVLTEMQRRLVTDPEGRIERTALYSHFLFWQEKAGFDTRHKNLSRNAFYADLQSRFYLTRMSNGVRYILGISEQGRQNCS